MRVLAAPQRGAFLVAGAMLVMGLALVALAVLTLLLGG